MREISKFAAIIIKKLVSKCKTCMFEGKFLNLICTINANYYRRCSSVDQVGNKRGMIEILL